jgi:pilus assembly protein Flp/PilA
MQMFKKKAPKGAAMVEYAVLLGAVTLIAVLGVSTLGHKASDLVGALAVILPGAHADDNAALTSARLIETQTSSASAEGVGDASAVLSVNAEAIRDGHNTFRLSANTGLGDSAGTGVGLNDLLIEVGD